MSEDLDRQLDRLEVRHGDILVLRTSQKLQPATATRWQDGRTAAAGVAAFAFCWQVAVTDGAQRMLAQDHAVALKAKRLRASTAEAITAEAIELRARDQATRDADTLKIKELIDALAKDPRRDGVCLPGLWSQRLRKL